MDYVFEPKHFIDRADRRFPLHNVDLPGKADVFPTLAYDVARVAGREAYSLHGVLYCCITCLSWVGSVLCRSHGGQHDAKYVTFELPLHAAFVADEIWGYVVEPQLLFAS